MALSGNVQLIAGGEQVLSQALALLEKEGITMHGNPDSYVRSYARFGIDEAREIRDRAALRPVGGGRRVFVISSPSFTADAQNALLKTLEESAALFCILTPAPYALLPALRSRAQFLKLDHSDSAADAQEFLRAPKAKRLDLLKPLLEKDEDDKRDLRPIIAFLSDLEGALASHIYEESAREGLEAACREGIEAVYRARTYLTDKGSLVKPLLEQVALLAPVVH